MVGEGGDRPAEGSRFLAGQLADIGLFSEWQSPAGNCDLQEEVLEVGGHMELEHRREGQVGDKN